MNPTPIEIAEAILTLVMAVGALLLSFNILSDNISKLATGGLKKLFNKTSNNPIIGISIGALVTAIIQSSAATTVMVVGFVNAGIMSLFQATAIIMGANIGTTITAQIVQLGLIESGNSIGFSTIVGVLVFIGVFGSMLVKKEKIKTILMVFAGLGMVFVSLDLMSGAMNVFRQAEGFRTLLTNTTNPLLLLLIGIALTALLQSSSAVTSIIITMVAAGLTIGDGGNAVLFVILGSNIGTCITALLSSLNANTNAKRASLIHLMFNLFGSLIFVIFLLLYPRFMEDVIAKLFPDAPATQIAMFHTFFNLVCTLIFTPIIPLFVKLTTVVIPDKKQKIETNYLDERLLKNTGIALGLAIKETMYLGNLSRKVLNSAIDDFINKTNDNEDDIRKDIEKIEKIHQAILDYLLQIASNDESSENEQVISALHKILIDFNREVEIADNMLKYTNQRLNNDLVFSEHVDEGIKKIQERLNYQYDLVMKLFVSKSKKTLKQSDAIEDEIDNLRNELIDGHIRRLEEGTCSPRSNTVFISLVSNLERAGDHLNYVAHTILEGGKNFATVSIVREGAKN